MFLGGDWHPATRLVNFCSATRGRVAQLGERLVRNEEAEGSNPFSSTNSVPYNTLRARGASRSSPGRPRVRIPSRPPIPSPTTHSALAERPGPHREGRGFESLLVHQFRPLQHTPRSQSVPVLTGKAEGSNPFSSTNSVPYNTLRARRASRSSPGRPRVRIPSRPPNSPDAIPPSRQIPISPIQ